MQAEHSTQGGFCTVIYQRLVSPDHLRRWIPPSSPTWFATVIVPTTVAPPGAPWCCSRRSSCSFSDRQVEEQVNLHLACKWFVGLRPDETGPDHTALTRFRARLGPEKFQAIFNGIVQQACEAGLVHDRLGILDAPRLAAKVDFFRLPPPGTPPAQATGSPDPDARFGRKSAKKRFYGYKEHLATDADSQVFAALVNPPARPNFFSASEKNA